MMKQSAKKMASVLLVFVLVFLAACSNNGNNNEGGNEASATPDATPTESSDSASTDPLGKYEEPVTIKTILSISQDPKFPEGESYENNKFLTYIEERLNIKQEYLWTAPTDGEQYANKLAISIASGDIPDMFMIEGTKSDALLKQLVEGDMIEDLTEVYEKYASEGVKSVHESINNQALEAVTFDGKLMALTGVNDLDNQVNVVWVRQDWLDELSLPAPDSLESLRTVAKAFAEKKGGIGLTLRAMNDGISSPQGDMHKFDVVFNAMNAYPSIWIKKGDKVEFGGVQPEVKEALAFAREMYANGEIDQEFAIKDNGQTAEDLSAGKSGLMFQPWWAPYWPLQNTISNDPNAVWAAYAIKSADGKLNASIDKVSNVYYVVRKGFEHPEALIKLLNLSTAMKDDQEKEMNKIRLVDYNGATEKFPYFPGLMGAMSAPDIITQTMSKFQGVMDGSLGMDALDTEQQDIYNKIVDYKENLLGKPLPEENRDENVAKWQQYYAWMVGLKPLLENEVVYVKNEFTQKTPTMETKWQTLLDLQRETYVKIVMGVEPVDYFDNFVKKWMDIGGEQITQEVNEAKQK